MRREKLLSYLPTLLPALLRQKELFETPSILLLLDINKHNETQSAEMHVIRSKKQLHQYSGVGRKEECRRCCAFISQRKIYNLSLITMSLDFVASAKLTSHSTFLKDLAYITVISMVKIQQICTWV